MPTTKLGTIARICGASAMAIAAALPGASAQEGAQERAQEAVAIFDIEAQPLSKALIAFSEQSKVVVSAPGRLVNGKQAPALQGAMSTEQALEALLEGSGLNYAVGDGGSITIIEVALRREARAAAPFRLAQAETAPEQIREQADDFPEDDDNARDEIIVTGTNIRGAQNLASPLTVIDRAEIDRSGFVTTQQLLRSVPSNLDTGENSANGLAGPTAGFAGATGVNIRGLGVGSTLTLVDGRRVAPATGVFQNVDVSLIPLSAVERVEILTDGASAIYGADAVAGVVNFILRDDFDGAETTLRVGGVTEGSSQEYQVSQTLGGSWSGGNVLGTYEYYRRNNLNTEARDFSQDALDPSELLPRTERHSFFATGRQGVTPGVEVFASANFTDNSTDADTANPLRVLSIETSVQQYGGSAGFRSALGQTDWAFELVGAFNGAKSENRSEDLLEGGLAPVGVNVNDSVFDLWTVDILVDGPVFEAPGGDVRLAVGGQYRSEEFEDVLTPVSGGPRLVRGFDRKIYSAFAELLAPIVGEGNRRSGIHALDLSVAGRFEDYSDFGSTFDPKVGVRYAPTNWLDLRGTYGASFQAPTFLDTLSGSGVGVFPGSFFAPPSGQTSAPNVAFLSGSNPDLDPEEATTWTVGFDAAPSFLEGFEISATYFNIEFKDRIGNPNSVPVVPQAFLDPSADLFVNTNPTLAQVEDLFLSPIVFNPFMLTPADIGAIIDGRLLNIGITNVDGVDFTLSYSADVAGGALSVGVNGSFINTFDTQVSSATPAVSIVDTAFNPVDLKFRGNVGWSNDAFSANLYINYTDDYTDPLPSGDVPVSSWTTVDLSMAYVFTDRSDLLNDLRVTLNIQNLFNEDPPFIEGTRGSVASTVFFDGSNANPIGRFVSLQLQKSF